MQFLIIAGGDSTRLQPIPDKNLLSFFGETLIARQLRIVGDIPECREGIIVGNPANIAELERIARSCAKRFPVRCIVQQEPDGLEDAILCAKDAVRDEPLLLIAGNDVVAPSAYTQLLKAGENSFAALLASRTKRYFPGGYLEVDSANHITRIVEKPAPGSEPSDLVNIVIHLYRSGTVLIDALERTRSGSSGTNHYDAALAYCIKNDMTCVAVPYEGTWQAVKFPWHVLDLMRVMFTEHAPKPFISKKAHIAKSASLNGPVWIEDNVRILDGAVVNGPVYLGEGAVVATNALVRESHIGARSVIGFSSEIARSYLGADVWTHSNYIGDSVIGDDVSFGAGTVVGNLRLDEKPIPVMVDGVKTDSEKIKLGAFIGPHVRIGINSSLMPGVKIGGGSLIGAGVVVSDDVPQGSFVTVGQEHTIRKNKHTETGDRSAFLRKLT